MKFPPNRSPLSDQQEFETEGAALRMQFERMCRLKGFTAAKTYVDTVVSLAAERDKGAAREEGWVA